MAAIRAVLGEQKSSEMSQRVEAQIERMNDIVRYQLRKPATLHTESLGVAAVAIDRELARLVEGLAKVYSEKKPDIELDVTAGMLFRGETGDFLEVAGNLLDNACKWCQRQVRLTIRPLPSYRLTSG